MLVRALGPSRKAITRATIWNCWQMPTRSTWSRKRRMEGRFTNGLLTNQIRASRAQPVRNRPAGRVVAHIVLALLWGAAVASEPKQPDPAEDPELLEFLGSVDSGGDSPTTADD